MFRLNVGPTILLLLGLLSAMGADCVDNRKVFVPAVDAGGDAIADTGTDAATDVCGGCSGATPVCDTVSMTCVECLASTDCSGATPVCDTSDNTCVECTTATEATDCAGNSCNPSTRECTTTAIGSLGTCEACISDTECSQGGVSRNCVMTQFMGSNHGTYCVENPSPNCTDPYDNPFMATSVGGVSATYCLPPGSATCEVILDYKEDCSVDADCGAPLVADGLCRSNGLADKCSYSCSADSDCAGVNSCSTDSPRYCCTGGSGSGCP